MWAWCRWRESDEGCCKCSTGHTDKKYCATWMKVICFNAFLHSTTNENKK
jgi:hypothetical protein